MPVHRTEKTENYTVMSNYHLRDKRLTLKAKGLLSVMLSLPNKWDYTLQGLACISAEKVDAIRGAVLELERAGYIVRSRSRNKRGELKETEYTIYEKPRIGFADVEKPITEFPATKKPATVHPATENPVLENPTLEKPTQLNTDRLKTDI